MELIRPWTTTIAKFNIADLVDLEEIGTAIVACCQQINGSYSAIRPEDPIAECLFNLRNDHITPKAGDVYIIPSDVRHSVMTVKDEYRLTFVNDYLLVPN